MPSNHKRVLIRMCLTFPRDTRIRIKHRSFYLSIVAVIATSYGAVQIILTDIHEAKRIYTQKTSIWEPTPPSNDYYILGQYFHFTDDRPGSDVQLIVGRSNDDSLRAPLGFYGKWQIQLKLFIWTMECPRNYVSLGAIASAENIEPDVKKYRCVKQDETEEAVMGKVIFNTTRRALRTVYSPDQQCWRNIFFVVDYDINFEGRRTRAFTLKTKPFIEANHSHDEADESKNNGLELDQYPRLDKTGKGNENEKAESYITLIVSASFVLLVIIVLTVLFCIRSRQMRRRNRSLSLSTGQTYIPSSGYASESEASFTESLRLGGRSRGRIHSASQPFILHHDRPLPIRTQRRSSECVLQQCSPITPAVRKRRPPALKRTQGWVILPVQASQ